MNQRLPTWISVVASVASLMICGAMTADGLWAQTGGEQPEATIVIVLRHAEKAGDSGNVDLSLAGEIRARILAQMCCSSGVGALYGVTYRENDRRIRETLEPIAKLTGLEPTILMEPDPIKKVVHEIRSKHGGKTILVVSHSGTVDEIVKALGGDESRCPIDDEYDNLCVVTLSGTAKVNVLRLKYGATKCP
jgi:broad specificity phosphatase PhoE